MKVIGLIAEYNPFHKGHKYHLLKSKEICKAEFSIAVMSGSFLQRGEPSFIDKWTKAKIAIDSGIDLVIELPFIFSTQSAETFAYGSVKLLDSLNIVDYLSFGSELGDVKPLMEIASILSKEPKYYSGKLKSYLDKGLSFPAARSMAIEDFALYSNYDLKYNFKNILKGSNNILAIEYLKALLKIKSNMLPIAIKRVGSSYKDTHISKEFSSAAAIRHYIKKQGLEGVKNSVPNETYYWLSKYLKEYGSFNYMKNYEDILIYLIRTGEKNKIKTLIDMETGLENRIIEKGFISNDINHIINSISTKRYPKTRIQRLLIHLLHNLYENEFNDLYKVYPSYVRVLGSNEKGLTLLRKIKKHSSLPIISKFANYKYLKDKKIEKIISFDKKATDIFFLGIKGDKVFSNMDYFTSPYIK